jgi:ankyrin repeat protein
MTVLVGCWIGLLVSASLEGVILFIDVLKPRDIVPWRRDGISPFIHVFESQAVPVYQLKPLQDLTHRFDWLGEDKTFKDWQAHQQTHFLHIHGSPNISEAAEYAFGVLDEARVLDTRDDMIFNKIMYFKFDRHDIRRNSVGAMANTFLSQILSRFRTTPSSLIKDFEPPDFSDCWTDKDAFIFLDKIRRCLGYRGQVNWILDGLDQCDESGHWLLSEILGVAARSEQLFKVIITSVDDKYICDALSEFPEIDLRKHRTVQPTGETHPGSEFALWAEVLQDRPKLGLMESKIRELLHSCGDDDQLRRLLLEWLRGSRFASGRAVEKEIQFLTPPSPKKLIQRLLESVKEDRRPWARKLIMWVMHAVRPLTPAELEIALVVNEASDESTVDLNASLDIMEEIKDCFGPLFVVENGEVHLGHPATREIFSPENTASDDHRPWYVLHDPREGHREIVTVCLYYLTLPGVQNRMVIACKASPNTQPILEGKSDILSYAIQFWPQHYRLGYVTSSTGDVSKAFSRFLDDKALQRWAGANWYFSNPHIRSDKSFLSPLPIIASLGLEALVIDLIKSMNQKEKDKIVPFALTEAAQNGHRTVVQSLMKASEIGESGYLEATVVAARSGQFDILADLLKHVWAEFKDIKLPSIITSRMAFFGADALLDAHLKAGADANPPAQSDYAPPIYVAAMRNNLTAVDVLLKQGANPDVSNTNWKDCLPIIAAAKNGHSSMVKKLVDAGASVEGKDAEGKPSLWWASFLGQHKAVQALIDAKANRSSVEVSLTEKLDWPIFISTAGSAFMKCNRALLAYGVNPNIPTTKGYPKYALGWAASQGHAEMCRQLIEEGGANVDGADDDKPIIHAARSGEREVIDLFIEKGANLDAMVDNDTLASTALITAVELNFVDLAKRLIEKNATVDLALSSGVTALYHAVYKGFVETVKVLIAAGGDLKTVAYTKKWGLVHIGYRRVECLKVLLDAGADINAVCKDGTALYLAAFNGHVETARLLISRGADTEIPCQAQEFWDDGHTPLPTAAALGHIEIVRALLEGGANPKTKTPRGATPLILAVANDKEDCVKALLEYDADLEAVDVDNDTALHAVEVSTPLSITKLLVNRGANIEHRGRQNYTFLGRAVASNIPDVVKYLLEKKATINVVGGYRGGPLHMAAYRGDIEILKLLIQHGGDINLGDPNLCGTPLQSALYPSNQIEDETTRTTIVRYIIEDASADVNAHAGLFGSALNVACLGNTVDHISLILENGADPGWADTYGRQPIHYASFKTIDHVQLLVDAGADVTAKNKIGQTALHIAGVTGRIDLVEIILSKARNLLNEPDVDGWTPLMWACRLCDKWNTPASLEPAIIQLLISEGADLWAKGKSEDREWSPLKLARYHGASEGVVKLLTPAVKSRIGKGGKEEVWDVKFHTSRRGPRTPGYCDVCLFVSLPCPFLLLTSLKLHFTCCLFH